MSQFIVTVIDTAGIQSYIFSSNRLRENIGASYLVQQATSSWVEEILQNLVKDTQRTVYIPPKSLSEENALPRIQNDTVAAELMYSGGGNTVLLFQQMADAKVFVRSLSRKILNEAPGLRIIAAHATFDWAIDNLQQIISDLVDKKITAKKRLGQTSSPLFGLGVTVDCNSTRLGAVGNSKEYGQIDENDNDHYPVSREVAKKLDAVPNANKQLKEIFSTIPRQRKFPYRFDDLGRTKHESSFIAVVHADGNGMGNRFKRYGQKAGQKQQVIDNASFIQRYRLLSRDVNRAGMSALKSVLEEVQNLITNEQFKLPDSHKYFPFRPLVYGGDDVTFVCDGRLGLVLAAKYLSEFEAQSQYTVDEEINGKLTACAGISIVKAHYPFASAYSLSESLCSQAKKFVQEESDQSFSALDWHIANAGLLGSLSEIRAREYRTAEGDLTMRPVRLAGEVDQWRTWSAFKQVVDKLADDADWGDRRNKVIALREALRAGPEKTKAFLKKYRLGDLPEFPESIDGLKKRGSIDGRCGYFDAIEALEFFPWR